MPTFRTVLLSAACFVASLVTTAYGQSFDLSADDFRARVNKRIEQDGGGAIKICTKSTAKVTCSFDDGPFQQSVMGFKQLNLANGRFKLIKSLNIVVKDNRVQRVIITGSRADPMNLFHFIGTVGSIIGSFEPSLDTKATAEIVTELGLMRGDDDPTIGQARQEFRDAVAIACDQYPSAVSTKVECVFEPRS